MGRENFVNSVYTSSFILHDTQSLDSAARTYKKGYTINIARNVIQRAMSKANTIASSLLAVEVWLTPNDAFYLTVLLRSSVWNITEPQ
jgi:hypothetical protein